MRGGGGEEAFLPPKTPSSLSPYAGGHAEQCRKVEPFCRGELLCKRAPLFSAVQQDRPNGEGEWMRGMLCVCMCNRKGKGNKMNTGMLLCYHPLPPHCKHLMAINHHSSSCRGIGSAQGAGMGTFSNGARSQNVGPCLLAKPFLLGLPAPSKELDPSPPLVLFKKANP